MIPQAGPHLTAVRDLLADLEGITVTVGQGADTARRLVLYPDPGDIDTSRLSGRNSRMTMHIMMHGVGTGPEQAIWILDRARPLLLGAQPSIDGRKVYPIWQSQQPQLLDRDDDVSPPVYLSVAEIAVSSEPR